jgi:Family of unknown function (DUF6527)
MAAAVIREIEPGRWMFWCPGCRGYHWYELSRWSHDGQLDAPTVTPSIVTPATGCHLWLRAGRSFTSMTAGMSLPAEPCLCRHLEDT